MDAYALVEHLPIASAPHALHHQILGHHERQLAPDIRRDDVLVYDDAADDVVVEQRDGVGGEERFRNRDAPVRGIIKRSFEPLRRRSDRRIERIDDQMPRQAVDPFRTHRVALVSHRR
jgi:hypothetical protein